MTPAGLAGGEAKADMENSHQHMEQGIEKPDGTGWKTVPALVQKLKSQNLHLQLQSPRAVRWNKELGGHLWMKTEGKAG